MVEMMNAVVSYAPYDNRYEKVPRSTADEAEIILKVNGCNVYIEASGSLRSVIQGLESLRNPGRYVQVGVFAEEVKADRNTIGDGKGLRMPMQ